MEAQAVHGQSSDTQPGQAPLHRRPHAPLPAEVMECAGGRAVPLTCWVGGKNRVNRAAKYWAQKKGSLALDTEAAAQGKTPTKFETTRRSCAGRPGRPPVAVSRGLCQRLLQRASPSGDRGRLSYLTADPQAITARKLGMSLTAPPSVPLWSATPPSQPEPSPASEQLRQPQGVSRMCELRAKKARARQRYDIGHHLQSETEWQPPSTSTQSNAFLARGMDAAVPPPMPLVMTAPHKLKPINWPEEKKDCGGRSSSTGTPRPSGEGLAAQQSPKPRRLPAGA